MESNSSLKNGNVVYNITLHADHSIHDAWLQWHKEEHIPEVMATKQFTEYRLFHLLEQDETEGITYVTQYFASSKDHLDKYVEEFSPAFRKKIIDKWGNHLVIFRTVMEVMH